MTSRDGTSTIPLWVGGLASLVILALTGLDFLQGRDPVSAIVGASAAFGVLVGGWVWADADQLGLPRTPWVMLVVLVPIVGLPAYLVAREIRRSSLAER